MRRVIDVEFVIDIATNECWASIRNPHNLTCEEENAVIKLILSGISVEKMIMLQLSLEEADELRKNL